MSALVPHKSKRPTPLPLSDFLLGNLNGHDFEGDSRTQARSDPKRLFVPESAKEAMFASRPIAEVSDRWAQKGHPLPEAQQNERAAPKKGAARG
jgi:hypothetical protein